MSIKFLVLCFFVQAALAQLQIGYYNHHCPQAEKIVFDVVAKHHGSDPSIAADLVRLLFHDCFVNGCDGSVLIDSKEGKPSEKNAGPNLSLDGFEILDEAKRELEAKCPMTVSCADIIALAARDSVALAGGPTYAVPTGRRDGLRSNPEDVNLPSPTVSVPAAVQAFEAQGLDIYDMVTLIGGGHSIGVAHCSVFGDRLDDPEMNHTLNARLRQTCGRPNNPTVLLDQMTPFTVDNGFYKEILNQNGILRIDQNLALKGSSTRGIVLGYASSNKIFRRRFPRAMVKMGNIKVLTGNAGEIRRSCRVFNSNKTNIGYLPPF